MSRADEGVVPFFDLRPYGFQQVILESIAAEREAGKGHHLIIAATGTGKTMVAAFDYRSFADRRGGLPRVLFVAHREEILRQARAAFRQVLREGSFGEILAGGADPLSYDHLFCTVQSWNSRGLHTLPSDHFSYVVLDEAHHAAADSYRRLIEHVRPESLLGLTATPERSDGKDIRDDFGGVFTHELRLPEAVERALLSPFHYYGIPALQGLDLSTIQWTRGGYEKSSLQELLEVNDDRARWVVDQTVAHVADIHRIRALGFCVSIVHARFMAEIFTQAGIPSAALVGESSREERETIQRKLRQRKIRCIFTVDLYNEGVDIPFVDTVLFLRPTESVTLFLQQLGRGLRLHDEKAQLTVLDFIAPQHRNFDFISRYRALSMRPEKRVDHQIEAGMPYVPVGCFVHLERQAQHYVLQTIRESTNRLRGNRFFRELRALVEHAAGGEERSLSLQQLMDQLHLDSPDGSYKRGLPANLIDAALHPQREEGLQAVKRADVGLAEGFRRLMLMDDLELLQDIRRMCVDRTHMLEETRIAEVELMLHAVLWGEGEQRRPEDGSVRAAQAYLKSHPGILRDLLELCDWMLTTTTPITQIPSPLTNGLRTHASYSRSQVLLAMGMGSFEQPYSSREGVLHVADRRVDLFFADIRKSEADFSPTTMYEDYAITDRLFHWQSQSVTSQASPTGQRYLHHKEMGYTPLLFIRDFKKTQNGLTAPYLFAGPLRYRRHEGDKPISIVWELEHPLPARVLQWARRVG